MNYVIRHIEYLVHRHDCVVLPKWGAFIAGYQPACYDEALGLMYPPVRELSFSASVDYNDGLLASSIARKEGMSFAQASQLVEDEISSMKHQLSLDGELSLGKVGRFLHQDEVSVIFEPAKDLSLIGSGGFDAVAIRPLLSKVKEEAINAGRIDSPRRGRLTRLGLRAIKAAAVVAVIVGISMVLLRPTFDRADDDMASIAPMMTQKSSQTSIAPSLEEGMTLNILVPQEINDDVALKPVEDTKANSAESVEKSVANNEPEAMSEVRLNANDRYCLVVASLPTMALAEKFVSENNSTPLGILSKDGKFRVYAATGNTTNEAIKGKDIAGIGARFADAWVCSMR